MALPLEVHVSCSFGSEHHIAYGPSGMCRPGGQNPMMDSTVATASRGFFLLGDQNRLGSSAWRWLDSTAPVFLLQPAGKFVPYGKRPRQHASAGNLFGGVHCPCSFAP